MSDDIKECLSVIIVIGGQSPRELQEYLALERVLGEMQIPYQVICCDHEPRRLVSDPRVPAILGCEDVPIVIGNHRPRDVLAGIIEQWMKNAVEIQGLVECSKLHFTYQKGHNYPWYLAFSSQRAPKVLGRRSSFK